METPRAERCPQRPRGTGPLPAPAPAGPRSPRGDGEPTLPTALPAASRPARRPSPRAAREPPGRRAPPRVRPRRGAQRPPEAALLGPARRRPRAAAGAARALSRGGPGHGVFPGLDGAAPRPDLASIPRPRFCSSYRPLSAGSIGHPTFCQTLCLFVRGGGHCPRGPGCAWCHHPSCKKKRYLDKKTRMLFRQMDDLTRITTVLPCLQAKIHELDSGTAATRALEKWRDDIMRMPQFAGHSLDAPGLEPYCVEALRRLSLTDLCGYPILPESVVACTKRLLMELMASEHTNS
ncbi:unnamed protein product [Prorocentrum cordatum]|uniref:Uncharacterized protein n=1 Tax=Prorocentrum cordatum TaxID=2364126 RepID=A0ABN9UDC5_9DINO|nr:unnamed protein product [Polarella glacialis]